MEDEAFERPQDVRPLEGLEEAAPNPEGLNEAASIPEGFGAVLPDPEVPEATEPGLEAPEDVNVPSVEGPRHYEFDAGNPYLAPEPPSRTPAWLELLMTVLGTLVLAVIIRVFIAETYEVPSGSMLETIQLGDRLGGHDARAVGAHLPHLESPVLQVFAGMKDGVMLDLCGDDMLSPAFLSKSSSFNCPVVTFRSARGKIDFRCILSPERMLHLSAGIFNRLSGGSPGRMNAGSIAVYFPKIGNHAIQHVFCNRCRSGMVKINAIHHFLFLSGC